MRNEPVKNADLWNKVFSLMEKHEIKGTTVKEHSYSKYLQNKLKRIDVELREDIKSEEKDA